jgi:putative NADH-flavin reductase
LLNAAELERAISGHDAILSGFGPRVPISKGDANLLRNFASALTVAMERGGVRRVVVVSTAFLFKDSIVPPTYLFGRLFFPGVVADASAMERIFIATDLEWTIVRPPQLTDKACTGRYRVRAGHLPRFGFKISRADVAHFFLKAVEDRGSVGKILGVSN